MGKIIRDGNVISTYNYEKAVDQSNFITMITRPVGAKLIVPEGVYIIGSYAFSTWGQLHSISLPDSITTIYSHAFDGDINMKLEGETLPKNLTEIYDYSFRNCNQLVFNRLPQKLKKIRQGAFYGCAGITSLDLTTIESIGASCFNHSGLQEVILSENQNNISAYCFSDTKLISITIPSSVITLDNGCFSRCTNLSKVIVKGNITTIASEAFYSCTSLSQFDLRNNTVVPTLSSVHSLGHASGCKIVIPNSLYDTWTTATNWAGLTDVQWIRAINSWDDTITAEGDYVLMSDLDLTDIRHLTPSAKIKGA